MLSSSLTGLALALGVMLVVAVLVISMVVKNSFESGNKLGYNMIVGSKGGRLDLLFNTVYYLGKPIEKIPWTYFNEFLPAMKRKDGKAGKFSQYVGLAIPVCLGDMVGAVRHKNAGPPSADDPLKGAVPLPDSMLGKYHVVGTNPAMFTDLLQAKFSDSEDPQQTDYDGCVVGGRSNKRLDLQVGDDMCPSHGTEIHNAFHVTGILERTGTPNDRRRVHQRGRVLHDRRPRNGCGGRRGHSPSGKSRRSRPAAEGFPISNPLTKKCLSSRSPRRNGESRPSSSEERANCPNCLPAIWLGSSTRNR